jgi:exodeoxyribonuclease VII large subunit
MNIKYVSISDLTRYIKAKFDMDYHLNKVYIKGEISNFKHHTRGHLYFTLKDENSRIAALMFASSAARLNFNPEDGQKVLVCGRISVYEATGNYQIYVESMEQDGIGNLYLEFEKLKKKLKEKGMFDEAHKKPIPKYPKKIGIITAPTGAAIRDILSTIKRRYPICETILFPALVQGENAKESIVKQINTAQDYDLDVIICGRGGGSIEDLWAFNE